MVGLVRPGIGTCESRLVSLKNTIMQASQDIDLLTGQALDPRIGRMGVQGHLGVRQPLAQRFRINVEQVTTLDKRKTGHGTDSFVRNSDDARA